jgi:hypothetical protein
MSGPERTHQRVFDMFGRDRARLALALVTTVAVGCGGGTDNTTSGGGGQGGGTATASTASSSSTTTTTATGSSSSSGGDWTVKPVEHCPKSTVFAVSKLYFGDGNNGQWKTFGFNLDGKVSTAASTDLCQLNDGAMASVPYPDGNNGIDNSFGKNILPLILDLDTTWPTDVNTSIQQGNFTALLELECLYPTGDVPSFSTKLFAGTPLGMPPKWDGTDMWPVEPDLLNDPTDPQSSSIVFNGCSVAGQTFTAGSNATIVLTIPATFNGVSTAIKLTLYAAQLTMTLAADRKSATGGMIGGVLNTAEFVAEVNNIGYLLGLCGNSLLANLITLVEQASDIMADGTQDPTKVCNGISLGFGFDMEAAQIGSVGPAAPAVNTCP